MGTTTLEKCWAVSPSDPVMQQPPTYTYSHSTEMCTFVHQETCSRIFVAAPCVMAPHWKYPNASQQEKESIMISSHNGVLYSRHETSTTKHNRMEESHKQSEWQRLTCFVWFTHIKYKTRQNDSVLLEVHMLRTTGVRMKETWVGFWGAGNIS